MDTNSTKDFFGFTDASDFLTSLFSPKTSLIQTGFASMAAVTTYITDYIWDSYAAIFTLWALMAVDWVTGLWYAKRSKTYWSRKNFRMPIYYICTTALLSLSYNLAKHNVIFFALPSLVYGGFCAVYLSSWVENMGKLGWIPEPIAKAVAKKFGLKEILKKLKKEEKGE